ncbi:MAG TPA: CAP domain-containing protein, partial [Candidatus Binatia bacterium]|nr:CAP domain-containing protein [Candidatus Binatia bacterium]
MSILLALVTWPGILDARPPATLGDPPPAPTPEDVARLPRRGISKHGPTGPFTVNTARREESRNFFNTVYAASQGFSIGWTGDLTTCSPGSTDPAFRDLVALRINYYRAMAGVPAGIVFDSTFNTKDQAAALIMSANNALDHYPATTWACYSSDGYEGAGNSNIALANAGPDAVSAYIEDFGANNAAAGHRRWLLYPQTQLMGTGDVPDTGANYAGNAVWVQDGHYYDARPATRDSFVSWPPPGFVPYPVVFARWSISFPDASFIGATVTMASNGVNVAVTKEPLSSSIGEPTLVWYPSDLNPYQPQPYFWPRPA